MYSITIEGSIDWIIRIFVPEKNMFRIQYTSIHKHKRYGAGLIALYNVNNKYKLSLDDRREMIEKWDRQLYRHTRETDKLSLWYNEYFIGAT